MSGSTAAARARAPAQRAPPPPARRPFTPRPSQRRVLAYRGGLMGIAAVPGSGKTETVAMLVDRILDLQVLRGDQEILVVTLVNAACDNLTRRVDAAAAARALMPGVGYRVRTLHALAGDIVRERPEAVGVTEAFRIIDGEQSARIRRQVAVAWLRGNRHRCEWLLDPDLPPERRAYVLRERMPELIEDLADVFIRYAKGERVPPDRLQGLLRDRGGAGDDDAGLAEIGISLYADYQRALSYRGALDFDDLVWRALDLLEADPALLDRLRERWPYVLEDEAQDSSAVQERILALLAGEQGNWVRVGDPNQAIFETFTTADPRFLRAFLRRDDVAARELPDSGRSAPRIIAVANRMIDWTAGCHPVAEARDALGLPHIRPTPPGDPQPNPADRQATVAFIDKPFPPGREAAAIAASLGRFLPANPEATVAVLAPSNHRAADLVQAIRGRGLRCVEDLLSGAGSAQAVADVIGRVLRALADPDSAYALADCYLAWRRADRDSPAEGDAAQACALRLRRCETPEDYLWPRLGRDWLDRQEIDTAERERLARFASLVRRWQGAAALPIDQMVLTISQDLFDEPDELAVAFRLAVGLRRSARQHPRWGIRELIDELQAIAGNRRRFASFAPDQAGFDPAAHRGAVVVANMHKAKGLEWDRVYLTSVNAYDYPADPESDRFIAEKWYVRDRLNAAVEACEEARCLLDGTEYRRREATYRARVDYIRERLRLLFVGITRARRDLIVTWNTGRPGDVRAAAAFSALADWWQAGREKEEHGDR